MEEIIDKARKTRKSELEIAEKIFKEWQETKFWKSVTELQYQTYLQTERTKQLN